MRRSRPSAESPHVANRLAVATMDWRESEGADSQLDLLTPAEAGKYLRTGERFVRRLIAERRIGYVKVGKFVRLERGELDRFIAAGRVNARDLRP